MLKYCDRYVSRFGDHVSTAKNGPWTTTHWTDTHTGTTHPKGNNKETDYDSISRIVTSETDPKAEASVTFKG